MFFVSHLSLIQPLSLTDGAVLRAAVVACPESDTHMQRLNAQAIVEVVFEFEEDVCLAAADIR